MKTFFFGLLVVLQVVDIATTLYGLKRRASESMYAMKNLMEWFGDAETALIVSKTIFLCLLIVFYADLHWVVFLLMDVLYLRITANNIKVIQRLG